jgi:hypothetical protein
MSAIIPAAFLLQDIIERIGDPRTVNAPLPPALARLEPLLATVLFWAACIAGYFLPSIVARRRSARNLGGIMVLNLLLGWTGLGWLATLIWAFSAETAEEARSKQSDDSRLAAAMRLPRA